MRKRFVGCAMSGQTIAQWVDRYQCPDCDRWLKLKKHPHTDKPQVPNHLPVPNQPKRQKGKFSNYGKAV